jgi:hypothetical protein
LNEAASVEHGLWALDQTRLIGTDIFHAEPIWWTIEMTAELRDRTCRRQRLTDTPLPDQHKMSVERMIKMDRNQ